MTHLGFRCSICGASYDEMPTAFLAPCPALVAEMSESEIAERVDQVSDQCVVDGELFFVLGNVDVPIIGTDQALRWSVWGSLAQKNFDRASDLWHTAGREQEPPYFSWLNNQVPGYPNTVNIKCLMHTNPVGVKPRIEVIDDGHPLAEDQRVGVSLERAHGLIHEAMHGEQ
jgi:hypothetical protein